MQQTYDLNDSEYVYKLPNLKIQFDGKPELTVTNSTN